MASYVLDSSVIAEYFVGTVFIAHARNLFQSPRTHTLYAVDFCRVEIANVLWKYMRNFGMEEQAAYQALTVLLRLPLRHESVHQLLPRAMTVGLANTLSMYDSVAIALAESLAIPLITLDEKQQRVAAAVGVATTPITDFA